MKSQHSHAPWRKTVLIPFWVFQIILELLMIAVFALALGVLATYKDLNYGGLDSSDVTPKVEGVAGLWLGLNSLCLILTIIEIILLARHKLKPATFVIMNSIKTGIWGTIFVFDIIAIAQAQNNVNYSRRRSAVGIVIEVLLLLCFLIPLIYGSVIYHRFRKQATYKPVGAGNHPYTNPAGDFGAPTSYPSAYGNANDIEAHHQSSNASYNGPNDPKFESYRQTPPSYGSPPPLGSPVPNIHVQHHDGEAFEMESSRKQLR